MLRLGRMEGEGRRPTYDDDFDSDEGDDDELHTVCGRLCGNDLTTAGDAVYDGTYLREQFSENRLHLVGRVRNSKRALTDGNVPLRRM